MSVNPLPDEPVELGQFVNPNELPHETLFLSSWEDIEHPKTLEIVYEEDGYLSCLKLTCNGKTNQFGKPPPASEISRTHTVNLDRGQWIEGFEMTIGDPIESREAGPVGIVNVDVWICGEEGHVERGSYRPEGRFHRLFVPADGNALVGVRGTSKGDRVNSFALIQCAGDQGLPRRSTNDEFTRCLTWRGRLPPPHIRVLPDSLAGLPRDELNSLRMEALLFGTDEGHDDAKTAADRLTGISASGNASRIELTFAGGSAQDSSPSSIIEAVGNPKIGISITKALKSLDIDGPGGDSITSVIMPPFPEADASWSWFTPLWFGIVTKHGRQAIFGNPLELNKARLVKPPRGFAIVGLFVSPAFSDCPTIGLLVAPAASPPASARIARDEHGRIWEGQAPGPGFWPCSPLIGRKDASFRGPRIAGSTIHVKSERDVIEQNQGRGKEWYTSNDKTGVRIRAVRVWGEGYLHGIQFEMENGECSPKWGKAGGKPSVSFVSGGNHKSKSVLCEGLKFIVRQPHGWFDDAPGPVMVQGTPVRSSSSSSMRSSSLGRFRRQAQHLMGRIRAC